MDREVLVKGGFGLVVIYVGFEDICEDFGFLLEWGGELLGGLGFMRDERVLEEGISSVGGGECLGFCSS